MLCNFCLQERDPKKTPCVQSGTEDVVICSVCVREIDAGTYIPPTESGSSLA